VVIRRYVDVPVETGYVPLGNNITDGCIKIPLKIKNFVVGIFFAQNA
jgi:hypothetical protein